MMELTNYQAKLLTLLNQPAKPRYTEQELHSLGIEYDRDEFLDLIKRGYIRFTKREPRREKEYFITPSGVQAINNLFQEQAEIEKADKFNSETLKLAREANKKASRANTVSIIAAIITAISLILQIVMEIVSL